MDDEKRRPDPVVVPIGQRSWFSKLLMLLITCFFLIVYWYNQHQKIEEKTGITYERANATFLTLCRNEELYFMAEVVQNFQDRFNDKYNYDWVFLNDVPFNDEFIQMMTNIVSGELKFGLVPKDHWDIPDHIDLSRMENSMEKLSKEKEFDDVIGVNIPYANSTSYRNMCRFQSGFFFQHELLDNYKYYWRVEPHVKLFCDIEYDIFKFMESGNKKYGFTISIFEFKKTIPTLFKTIKNFLIEKNLTSLLTSSENLSSFIYDEDLDDYTLCHFWSNFEIADIEFFRSPEYLEFFQYLDQTGGFYYERWGDLPIHSIAASLFLQKNEIHWFKDIGYSHPPYTQCPQTNFWENKCSCDPQRDFTFNLYSCTGFYLEVMNT